MASGRIKGITIDIGANTTELQKALDGMNKSLEKTQQQLRDVNKLLKLDPKNTELLRQKQELLSKAIGDTEEKLAKLKEASKQTEKSGITDENRQQYEALQREIIATEQDLKKLNAEQDKLAKSNISNVSKQFDQLGKKISSVGDAMTKKVTVPLLALGTASVAAFKDVDKGLDAVAIKTGATGDDLAAMQETVKDLGTEIPASFEDIGNAVGEVNTRFGLTGQELDDMSEKFLKFARVNDTDVTTSIDSTQKVLAAFGMDLSEAGDLLDTFTAVGQRTGLSVDKMASLMIKAGPQLKAMGLDAYQAANYLGDMEKSGIDVTQSMTAMQKAMKYAAKEGKALPEVLSDFDAIMKSNLSETEKLNKAYEIFGTKSGAAMYNAAKSGTVAFDKLGETMEDNSGILERTYDNITDGTDDMKTAFNALKEAGAEVGAAISSTLAPMLKKAAEALRKFSKWFNQLSPKTKELITKLGLLAAAAGPILSIAGRITSKVGTIIKNGPKLISGVKGLVTALATNPYLAIAAGAAAAAAGIAALILSQNKITREYEKAKKAREEEIEGVYAQAETAEIYAKKLDELMAKEEKSASDKQLIKTYVDELNGSVDGLNLKYDEEADKLNTSTEKIREKIAAYKDQALAQAYQNQMQEVANELVQTEMELDQTRTKIAEAEAKKRMATTDDEIMYWQSEIDNLSNKERQLTDKQNGLMEELDTYAQKASGDIKQVGDDMEEVADTAGPKGEKTGANLDGGVAKGIKDNTSVALEAARQMVDAVVKEMEKAGEIKSPSKVTRRLIGKNLALGVGVGMLDELATVEKDAEKFMNGTINAMMSTPPQVNVAGMSTVTKSVGSIGSGANSGKTVNQQINIYQPVSTPAETARAIRQQEIVQGLAG